MGSGSRILSIEDDPMVRRVLVTVLSERGHEVLEAGDGDSGLQAARDELPDLILLDLGLPGTHGTVVLGRLRDDPVTRGIPVIVVSAWGEGHVVAMARARGAVDVIRKPFGINDLVDRVEAALPQGG
jgi:DNA-binding response OmpR family regulator